MRSVTLAALRFRHDSSNEADARSAARSDARRLAKNQGLPVPAWAAKRRPGDPEPSPAPPLPVEPPPEIPSALRAWRESQPARVVNVHRDGSVRLITFTTAGVRQEAAFTTARDAERALLLGVSWRSPEARALAKGAPGVRRPIGRVAGVSGA
jgi:hypothetical protein